VRSSSARASSAVSCACAAASLGSGGPCARELVAQLGEAERVGSSAQPLNLHLLLLEAH
jgi:hypothetical protein